MVQSRRLPAASGAHGDKRPYVCSSGYMHNYENGRVECVLCGRGAYSHRSDTMIQWEQAHSKCCKHRVGSVHV